MSRPQWFALAALALVCLVGGANSPQSEDFLHPWRLLAGLLPGGPA